jgi:AraC-like DNA-binding protein
MENEELASPALDVSQPLSFSTTDAEPSQRLAYWHDALCKHIIEMDCTKPVPYDFSASMEIKQFGSLTLVHASVSQVELARKPSHIARSNNRDTIFHLCLAGRARVEQGPNSGAIAAGDFVLVDENVPYEAVTLHPPNPDRADAPVEWLCVKLDRSEIERRIGNIGVVAGRRIPGTAEIARITRSFLAAVAASAGKMPIAQRTMLMEQTVDLIGATIVGALDQPVGSTMYRTSLLHRIKLHIRQNLHDTQLSTQSIAAAFRISPRHVQGLFAEYGESPGAYVRGQRLELARRRLNTAIHGHGSIEDIAVACGFGSLAHFSRSFKAAYGESPRSYLRSSRKA